ncbi:hypothetical protein Hsero_3246 [Herbaspirillum seropedicae SmR1]|uniref:Uncharacterized protein n=1 Tax=Herbaspirillum seropedicae (strain SmR1) TaxID=757424 RepID=D8J1F8_HERSS|nr:hypothetical protein Hsero_3246 [Herbaspirillum seropedicae SmR1]
MRAIAPATAVGVALPVFCPRNLACRRITANAEAMPPSGRQTPTRRKSPCATRI